MVLLHQNAFTTSRGTTSSAPFEFAGTWPARLIATAIHAGHGLRPELAELIALPEADRLREEDPFTDRLIDGFDTRVYVDRSRFEVDLNRDADGAVYRSPAEAWDLKVWHDTELDAANVAASREIHTAFYDELRARLDECAKHGPFVIYDVHSYNHRRDGADRPAAPEADNPEVNVGTGSLNSERFGGIVTAFIGALQAQRVPWGTLDVRENVRFFGGHLAQWVHENYPETGIVLALEFKKTFMDEWSGIPDEAHLRALNAALRETVPATLAALDKLEAP
ncbi:N-formylglutamate amidohydrolase [Bowdeniella nasicola]|uniref:N-formylglutamate amidohydrolase n=1 Tax=Bowdeniella nasicola TaxID=208480 RepID=UPI000AF52AF7|nr:N-formylglutamate amidohydrolase [Bowdeniella nasicola]